MNNVYNIYSNAIKSSELIYLSGFYIATHARRTYADLILQLSQADTALQRTMCCVSLMKAEVQYLSIYGSLVPGWLALLFHAARWHSCYSGASPLLHPFLCLCFLPLLSIPPLPDK